VAQKLSRGRAKATDAAPPPPPDFAAYLRATLPRGWTADAPHLRLIAQHLDAVERGEIDRLAIHMPPRHAKTETTTIRGAGWMLERAPESNVLVTAYNQRIANRFSRKTRNLLAGRVQIAADQKAADEWGTTQGGTFMARGVGSPPTGLGFRRIFFDDPIRRRQDAESEVYRERVWDWYTDDLYTRLEPGGAIVLVATRWHMDGRRWNRWARERRRKRHQHYLLHGFRWWWWCWRSRTKQQQSWQCCKRRPRRGGGLHIYFRPHQRYSRRRWRRSVHSRPRHRRRGSIWRRKRQREQHRRHQRNDLGVRWRRQRSVCLRYR
jgi:hypothetical protein